MLWPAGESWPMCDGPKGGDHFDSCPGEAAAPLVPVLQLFAADVPELPFPDGTDLLQVLWCPFDHEPWGSPKPRLWWRRSADVTTVASTPPPDAESAPRHVPAACVLDPERVVEYPVQELPRAVRDEIGDEIERIEEETGWSYDDDLSVASGTKVGGYPGWTQDGVWPECDCGAVMHHVVTVASWEFSTGNEKRWIPLEDRVAMAEWRWDAPADHPAHRVKNPTGLMLGDVGGIYLFVCTVCPDRPSDYVFDCC